MRRRPCRPVRVGLMAGLMALACGSAGAVVVGRAPDTPAAHVDANTAASSWTSAVAVIVNGGAYSGVVVSPRHVLTANHVIAGAAPAAVSAQINSQSTPVVIGAQSIAVFPSASFPYDDLALITLKGNVPDAVRVLPIRREALPANTVVTIVGYGASGQGDIGPTVPGNALVKRSGRNRIDAVQNVIDSTDRRSLFFLFDFDGPSGSGILGGTTLGNSLEVGLGSGDSGSPVFAEIAGQRWLIGINNFAAPPGSNPLDYKFGTMGGGMLLSDSRFINWLVAQTQGTLGRSPGDNGDVPLPEWALGTLAFGLAALGRSREARRMRR